MLDEPSLGLAPKVVEEVFTMIEKLNNMDITVLLVEQNVHKALEIAARAYLLDAGTLVETGAANELLQSDLVVQSYLGAGAVF
ncbi:MAG: hypothetical protein ACR2RB_21090 [Gammaproteobacteria bacterium]